jgi:hypothetical protein
MSIRKAGVMVLAVTALVGAVGSAQPRHGPEIHGRIEIRERGISHLPMGARHIYIGGRPYWYHGGVYYMVDDDGSYMMVGAPVVSVLPRGYRVVVIGGSSYYVADDVYYRWTPDGYVVVERPMDPPVVVTAPPAPPVPAPAPEIVTIYAPKKDADGFTSVTLKKITGGYLGPQGEFYPIMPKVSFLTEMYGVADILRQTPADTYFVYVPNKDGQTYTRVQLTKRNGGYVGPQGEFYPIMPTVAHLAEMYGASKEAPRTTEAAPPIPAAEAPKADNSVTHVQVTKKNGQGTVDVVLKRQATGGYVGPQGEFYPDMPSVSQLTEVYGAE